MTNEIMVAEDNMPVVPGEAYPAHSDPVQYYPVNDVRTGKFVDEVIAAAKDDRMNTKRAISADIASTARVQNQNDRVIAACERELRRKDLSEESRDEILRCMSRAAESTSCESAASREFQREQLDHSHKLPWKLIGVGILIVLGGVGGTALIKVAA